MYTHIHISFYILHSIRLYYIMLFECIIVCYVLNIHICIKHMLYLLYMRGSTNNASIIHGSSGSSVEPRPQDGLTFGSTATFNTSIISATICTQHI